MTMVTEVNPLTEEKRSRIINTLLDSFNGSKEMIKDSRQVAYTDQKMRCKCEAAVPSACYKDIYSYVMEYKVVTLGKLFDVDMRTVRRYLMKVCEKLGYRGIRTYHFRKLYYGIKCVR